MDHTSSLILLISLIAIISVMVAFPIMIIMGAVGMVRKTAHVVFKPRKLRRK